MGRVGGLDGVRQWRRQGISDAGLRRLLKRILKASGEKGVSEGGVPQQGEESDREPRRSSLLPGGKILLAIPPRASRQPKEQKERMGFHQFIHCNPSGSSLQ
jgi:hypothetical protein